MLIGVLAECESPKSAILVRGSFCAIEERPILAQIMQESTMRYENNSLLRSLV